jgi:hypothetical protein
LEGEWDRIARALEAFWILDFETTDEHR